MGRALGVGAVAALALTAVAVTNDCIPAAPVQAAPEPLATAPAPPDTAAAVLVTLDGVRWQEIFQGVDAALAARARLGPALERGPRELLPNIHRLFFDGGIALGDPRLSGGIEGSARRHVSVPGYVEISTGASTECVDNDCRPVLGETLADAAANDPGNPAGAAVFGSWSEITRAAAAHPERVYVRTGKAIAEGVPPFPGNGDYVPDRLTAARGLAHLRSAQPRLLWIALGDTDEWAHRDDYGGYLDALRAADRFLGDLADELGHLGAYGERTAIFVTADHGRDDGFVDHGGPASGAVWLLARGPRIHRRGAMGTSRRRQLRDVAPTLRALLGLPQRVCATCGEPIPELTTWL